MKLQAIATPRSSPRTSSRRTPARSKHGTKANQLWQRVRPGRLTAGQIGVRWNRDLLGNLGVTVADAPTGKLAKQDFRLHEWFDLRQNAGLQFTVLNAALRKFTGGSLQMRGGYVLKLRDGSRSTCAI